MRPTRVLTTTGRFSLRTNSTTRTLRHMGFLTRIGLPILLSRAIHFVPVFPMVRSEILLALVLTACLTPEIVGAVRSVQSAYTAICSIHLRLTVAIVRRSLG